MNGHPAHRWLVDDLKPNLLMGMDKLHQLGAIIDTWAQRIRIGQTDIPFSSHSKNAPVHRRAKAHRDFVIPPGAKEKLPVSYTTGHAMHNEGLPRHDKLVA